MAGCDQGFGDCDSDPKTCETSLDTLSNCGACNAACTKTSCAGGVCSATVCTAPMADCDGLGGTCEANLSTDPNNCGACKSACAFGSGVTPHATLTGCGSGKCTLKCDTGYGDCDGTADCNDSLAAHALGIRARWLPSRAPERHAFASLGQLACAAGAQPRRACAG